MACYQYKTILQKATGITPFKAMYGFEVFDFGAEIDLQTRIDEDPSIGETLPKILAKYRKVLLRRGIRARIQAKNN